MVEAGDKEILEVKTKERKRKRSDGMNIVIRYACMQVHALYCYGKLSYIVVIHYYNYCRA
jgi:hypothetical protein